MINDKHLVELLKYGVCGALSTIIDIGIFGFLANCLNIYYLISNAIAWIIALIFSFLANKYYVFESKSFRKDVLIKESAEFFGARGLACGIDMGGMFFLVSMLGMNKNYAKLIITVVVIIMNYYLSKYWIFKKR